MSDDELRQSMLRYYDERASEYEEAYVRGTGTASIPDPSLFRTEASQLAGIVQRVARGRLVDLACGTGYWLPHYAEQCSSITLFDQSGRMLDECRKKIAALGIAQRCSLIQADFFDTDLAIGQYDCALVGFFLSHLTDTQEPLLFAALRKLLGTSGHFLILDSAWSAERARFNAKVERQARRLNDGTVFDIYKRYCDREEISSWPNTYNLMMSLEHFGTAFFAVSGRFV